MKREIVGKQLILARDRVALHQVAPLASMTPRRMLQNHGDTRPSRLVVNAVAFPLHFEAHIATNSSVVTADSLSLIGCDLWIAHPVSQYFDRAH